MGGRLALSPSSCLWLAFLWKQNVTDYWESGDIKLLFWTSWQAVSEIRVPNAAVWVIKSLEVRTVCANNAMRNTKSNWNSPRRFSFWIPWCRLIKIQGMSGRQRRKKPYWAYPVIYSPQGKRDSVVFGLGFKLKPWRQSEFKATCPLYWKHKITKLCWSHGYFPPSDDETHSPKQSTER